MSEQELFKQVHDQILDYAEEEIISRCANWGYMVSQMLLKYNRYLVQAGAEQSSPFIYAVVTAVIIGEFAKRAFNDHFDPEATIDLDLLDMDFEQVKGFVDEDTIAERLKLLTESNTVSLQDIWVTIHDWEEDIYRALIEIYTGQGEKDSDYRIFISLWNIYQDADESDSHNRFMTDAQKLDAYGFVSNGFRK